MNTYTDSEREPRGRMVRALARNRPLPTSKNPHFQNEARCTTFLVKMSFICMRMENDFPYQRLSTYPRFETEARVPRVPSSSTVPPCPLASFVHGSPEIKSSTTLENSQLVCLRPVGIPNPCMFDLNFLFQSFARPH